MSETASPLLDLRHCATGAKGTITEVLPAPGLGAPLRRMAELGLRRGASIVVGQNTPGGGRVIGVDGTRLALDPDLLGLLRVRP
ncbi:FeoA family protein [Propionibacteriaceae bacterium Y1923]